MLMAPLASTLLTVMLVAAGSATEAGEVVVAPAARVMSLPAGDMGGLVMLDWSDPEALRARGLGDPDRRRPIQSYETALCELTADRRLGAVVLDVPAEVTDAATAPGVAPETSSTACSPVVQAKKAVAADRAAEARRWTVAGGVTVNLASRALAPSPQDEHTVSPEAWGEFLTHPGQIRHPQIGPRERGDKLRYPILRDTQLGFDGQSVRVRMRYPAVDGH
jgi:hypothetical protein